MTNKACEGGVTKHEIDRIAGDVELGHPRRIRDVRDQKSVHGPYQDIARPFLLRAISLSSSRMTENFALSKNLTQKSSAATKRWNQANPRARASARHCSRHMIDPDILTLARKKGTDKQYRRWISHQPSCVSGMFSEWVDGIGRTEAAHVRRAGQSGTGYKAEYSCVPLTRQEHADQHQHGESYFGGKEFFDAQRLKYLIRWIAS